MNVTQNHKMMLLRLQSRFAFVPPVYCYQNERILRAVRNAPEAQEVLQPLERVSVVDSAFFRAYVGCLIPLGTAAVRETVMIWRTEIEF